MNEKHAFIDYVRVWCASGRGGDGLVHFRREKFVPQGGPDGGDGGRGGHVIVRGSERLRSLLHLRYKRHWKAGNGKPGGPNNRTGASGEDVYIDVPPGTVVKDANSGEVLFEVFDSEEHILLRGGRGGRGNAALKSATCRTPDFAEKGEPGREGWFIFELKLIADVGLVGLPNAGKSSLLACVSAARPRIAPYPFTTVEPVLGVVHVDERHSFVLADIPGLVEGAHKGKGMGHYFLRHVERTRVLIILLAPDLCDIIEQREILQNEMKLYSPALLAKPILYALNKVDLLTEEHRKALQVKWRERYAEPLHMVSAVTGEGAAQLMRRAYEVLARSEGA